MTAHEKLKHAPLVLMVAQVNFSPVEDMETHIPVIQSKLRELGYPYFDDKHPLQEIMVTPAGLQVNETKQWFFTDKKKKTCIVLTKNMLTVNTAAYTTFKNYLSIFTEALDVITQELSLEVYNALEQVSLRYVDHICSIGGKKPEELIKAEFLGGFNQDETVELRQVLIEKKTDIGGIVRVVLFKPVDIQSALAEIQTTRLDFGGLDTNSPRIVLDMSHTKKALSEDFNQKQILNTLNQLHRDVDDLFFEGIPTNEALELWGGK